jgi:hypothetical protein
MTQTEEFRFLKERVISGYQRYIDTIKLFCFEDLKDLSKRVDLLHAFNRSVLSNVSFRNFIMEITRPDLELIGDGSL